MNFIAQTDRFARQIEAWKQGHGFSDLEALKDLMDVWYEFINIPERRAVSYPGAGGEIPKVDYKCGKCGPLSDALTLIDAWRKHLVNEVTVDFKGVPQAKVEVVKDIASEILKSPLFKDATVLSSVSNEVDYSKLKMHELRSLAKGKGIVYTNKTTKEVLIKLISEKHG